MRCIFCLLLLIVPIQVFSASVENLDEVVARKTRFSTVVWGFELLENASNYYTWQPETLTYRDQTTNNEVWRMTYSPMHVGGENEDIATTHWSANGNRLLIHSYRTTGAFNNYSSSGGLNPAWFIINADGSKFKPALGAAAQLATVDHYVAWSPVIPDVLYQGNSNDGQGLPSNILYKVTVSDTTISRIPYLTLPSPVTQISVKKGMSGDGSTLMIHDVANGLVFPVTVYPSPSLLSSNGYEQLLNFDNYWGSTGSYGTFTYYHDQYTSGAINGIDGIWYYLMPLGTLGSHAAFWKSRPTGSGTNNSPVHNASETPTGGYYLWDHVGPSWNGSTVEPVNTMTDTLYGPDPWCPQGIISGTDCQDAPTHISPDRWGHYTIFEKTNDAPYGLAHYDARVHKYKSIIQGMQNGDHTDWEAWSDWSISDGSSSFTDDWNGVNGVKRIYTQNYLGTTPQEVAYYHSNYNQGNTTASSYIGPIQSPDGTKVEYVTTFMNTSDSNHQLFYAVTYYPYPPQIKSATGSGGNVQINWDFNQGSSCATQSTSSTRTGPTPNLTNPRTYATRGWPHETLDCPPSPREISQFRVWVSSDSTTWSPIGTTFYNNCRAGNSNECGMWGESSWSYTNIQGASSTLYYAVTSLEYSGLESQVLSNSWKVTTDSGGAVISQAQQNAYPTAPGSKNTFYTTSPSSPTGLTESTSTTAGQYNLCWTEPTNKTLVRYYNIYALDGNTPTAVQNRRIASVPVGTTSYIDWAGNTDGSTQYLITSVDYQGNESYSFTSNKVATVRTGIGTVPLTRSTVNSVPTIR